MSSAISSAGKKLHKKIKNISHPSVILFSLIIIFILGPYLFYSINYMGRIYPNIYVSGVNVGGKTEAQAIEILSERVSAPSEINLIGQSKSFPLNTKNIDLNYDFKSSAERAFNLTRTGNFFLDTWIRVSLTVKKQGIGLTSTLNEYELSSFLAVVSDQANIQPVEPNIQNVGGNIQVNKGLAGSVVDLESLRADIGHNLSYGISHDINIPMKIIDPTLTDNEAALAKIRGQKYLGKSIDLKFEPRDFSYTEADILSFLNPHGGYKDLSISFVAGKIAGEINRDPQNPKFEFNGKRVTEFQPAINGVSLDNQKFKDLFTSKLDDLALSLDKNISFDVPVITKLPDVSMDQVNNLGIKELIGSGNSTYYHSIPGRVFNVDLAASRINGTLVKPGDTFSFNQTLGDVSKFTGYQQAYIISNGRTILGDGGGVCQVSTTLFRAVLNAGLPIDERAAHAYRVGYYEQNSPPGLDATVYAPEPDFKFTNNTPNYILIEAKNDPNNYALVFDIYGTSDGRVSTISKPVVSDYSAPLPTVYQDDPTLPVGTLKQTDFAASGAKVVFNYSVAREGQQIYQKTFISNYQPWAAVYLRGTGPAI